MTSRELYLLLRSVNQQSRNKYPVRYQLQPGVSKPRSIGGGQVMVDVAIGERQAIHQVNQATHSVQILTLTKTAASRGS